MARRDPPSHLERLAAVLGPDRSVRPWPPGGAAQSSLPSEDGTDEPGTEPLLAVPAPGAGQGRLRARLRMLVPDGWRRARLDPGRPGATALALVAALAAVVAAIGVWSDRPRAEPVSGLPAVAVADAAGADSSGAPAGAGTQSAAADPPSDASVAPLVVSVSGRVARPGLVQVPDGARVADVVAAAGGALPGTDLSGLNLARRVADGEQVAVGLPGVPDVSPAPAAGSGTGTAGGRAAPAGKVDLNSATAEQLDALPGVGPVTAERIIEWRTRNRRFARVEQLREVEGIGERRFGQLRELVTV